MKQPKLAISGRRKSSVDASSARMGLANNPANNASTSRPDVRFPGIVYDRRTMSASDVSVNKQKPIVAPQDAPIGRSGPVKPMNLFSQIQSIEETTTASPLPARSESIKEQHKRVPSRLDPISVSHALSQSLPAQPHPLNASLPMGKSDEPVRVPGGASPRMGAREMRRQEKAARVQAIALLPGGKSPLEGLTGLLRLKAEVRYMSKRTFRVFISSPGGLEEERKILHEQLFPEIRNACEEAGLFFVPIDVRWNGGDAQDKDHSLALALEEMTDCDIFVGFLAQKYGACAETSPEAEAAISRAITADPDGGTWLEPHKGKSVTEIEFIRGHMLEPGKRHAIFALRSDTYDEALRNATQGSIESTKYSAESEDAAVSVEELKIRIRLSAREGRCALYDDYDDPAQGAKLVADKLMAIAMDLISARQEVGFGLGDAEACAHEAFLLSRAGENQVYVGGEKYFAAIDGHIEHSVTPGTPPVLLITGEAGCGKSSLIANWVYRANLRRAAELGGISTANNNVSGAPNDPLSTSASAAAVTVHDGSDETGHGRTSEVAHAGPGAGAVTQPGSLGASFSHTGGDSASGHSSAPVSAAPRPVYHFVGSSTNSTDPSNTLRRLIIGIEIALGVPPTDPGRLENLIKLTRTPHERRPAHGDAHTTIHEDKVAAATTTEGAGATASSLSTVGSSHATSHDADGKDEAPFEALVERLCDLCRTVDENAPKIVLVIDAADQFENRNHAADLDWLSRAADTAGPNMRFLVSAVSESRAMLAARKRGWKTMLLLHLTVEERSKVIMEVLKQRSRSLTESQIAAIVNSQQTASPLYLKAVLEEVCVYDQEKIDKKIDQVLMSRNTSSLFVRVLLRLEKEARRASHTALNVVADVMGAIKMSRYGLSESEVLDLLGDRQRYWLPLYHSIRRYLVVRAGLVGFFHRQLADAVVEKYLSEPSRVKAHRTRLAQTFAQYEPTSERRIQEYPWQLMHIGDKDALFDYIITPAVFEKMCRGPYKFDLLRYWQYLGKSGREICDAYRRVFADWQRARSRKPSVSNSSATLNGTATLDASNMAAMAAAASGAVDEPHPLGQEEYAAGSTTFLSETAAARVTKAMLDLGSFLYFAGYSSEAVKPFERALKLTEQVHGRDHQRVAVILNNLAIIREMEGNHVEAAKMYERSMSIRIESEGECTIEMAQMYHSLAAVYEAALQYPRAAELYERALVIKQKLLSDSNCEVAITLSALGQTKSFLGMRAEALKMFVRASRIYEAKYGENCVEVADCHSHMAAIYEDLMDLPHALEHYKKCLDIRQAQRDSMQPETAVALNNLAGVYIKVGDKRKALDLLNRALLVKQTVMGKHHPSVASTLENLAVVYESMMEDNDKALELRAVALQIKIIALGEKHIDVGSSRHCLSMLYSKIGELDKAADQARLALVIYTDTYTNSSPMLVPVMENYSTILQSKGDVEGALSLLKGAIAIRETDPATGPVDIVQAGIRLATVLQGNERHKEALPLFMKACRALKAANGPNDFQAAVVMERIAKSQEAMGNPESALDSYWEALEMREASRMAALEAASDNSFNGVKAHQEQLHPSGDSADFVSVETQVASIVNTLGNLVRLLAAKGQFEAALPLLIRRIQAMDKIGQNTSTAYATDLHNAGAMSLKLGHTDARSRQLLEKALDLRVKLLGADHEQTCSTRQWLAGWPPESSQDRAMLRSSSEEEMTLSSTPQMPRTRMR